jgi:hypothetical protein
MNRFFFLLLWAAAPACTATDLGPHAAMIEARHRDASGR